MITVLEEVFFYGNIVYESTIGALQIGDLKSLFFSFNRTMTARYSRIAEVHGVGFFPTNEQFFLSDRESLPSQWPAKDNESCIHFSVTQEFELSIDSTSGLGN